MAFKSNANQGQGNGAAPIIVTPQQSATPAVARAACILDLLSESRAPMSLAELSKMLAAPKSSLHTICATLVELRLIRRLENGHMTLGPHVMNWANSFLSRSEITREFYSLLDEEDILPQETITLSVLDGTNVVYIACRDGTRPLGITFRIGMHLPAPFTATGKAMLSTYPDNEIKQRFSHEWPAKLTARGVPSLTAFLAELSQHRQKGYFVDGGEIREGMMSFGAPIFDSSGKRAVAALAISLLAADTNESLKKTAGNEAKALAVKLSVRLGADIR